MLKFIWVMYMIESKKPRNRIAELRKESSLTLQQVADTIGVGNNTISRYETGKRKPSKEVLTKLSNLFKVPVSYLAGDGWSQDNIVWFLMNVYINKYNEDFELPSGIHSYCGRIEKYGVENETFEDFNNEDIPGFIEKAKEFLINSKNDEIVHDLILNYYNGDDVDVDNNEIENYVDDEFDELVEKYISDNELETLRNETLEELKDDEVNLPSIIEKLISEKLLNQLNFFYFEENNDVDIDYLKSHISDSFFQKFKKEIADKVNFLNDYVFLSSIGENFDNTGISPEYEIAKRISNDLKLKDFKDRQEYFHHDPYKASEEAITNLTISSSDKSSLMDIINYLLDENEELKERIDELSEQINNTDDFNETSNRDYRGNR